MLIKGLVGAALFSVASAASAAPILTNGGFEQPPIAPPCCNTVGAPNGFPGWVVNSGDINVVIGTFGSTNGNLAYEGSQYLDLIGQSGGGTLTSVAFGTTAGQVYNLSFAYSHNIFGGLPAASASFVIGALNGTLTHSTGTTSNLDWRIYNGTFVGTGSPMTLSFTNTLGSRDAGFLLDAVSISAAPEPGTWAMMIAGFGIAGVALRRRRRGSLATA